MKRKFLLTLSMALVAGLGLQAETLHKLHPDTTTECSEITNETMVNGVFPIPALSEWKYNDSGADLGTAWKEVAFDDAAWASGNGILGYGDGVESTPLSFGPDANNKYPTYYFRNTFDIADASQYNDLIFDVMRDDGVVVYVNGTEVFRMNMPAGPITYTTYASSTVGGSDEGTYFQALTDNLLQNGTNVIAVELHQASPSSSDLRFDMEVSSSLPPLAPTPYPVAKDSQWKYLDDGSSLDAVNWTEVAYDNAAWANNFGPLGYGDPVNTPISFGPDANNKYITYYFTKDIEVDLASVADFVEFGLKRDDGAIVYVNGVEVFRENMPAGAVDYLTTSSTITDGINENIYFIHQLPKSVFTDGLNRIAVEVHNRDGQSSDIKFDMYIKDMQDLSIDCDTPHIGCFTSIVPTGQTSNMIIPTEHNFQQIFKQGDPYTTGTGNVPGNHDFTGYIADNGSSSLGYLSVNHETTPGGVSIVDLHLDPQTNLWVIDASQPVDLYNNALVTTVRNCSGGISPWGTAITAEENTSAGDANGDGYEDVGWLVEIDPVTRQVVDYGNGQEKLWAMGRMNHENVVVSEDQVTAYYGEDGGTDCVYKFVADTPGDLSAGTVYVLKLDLPLSNNDPSSATATWIEVPNTTQADRNNISSLAGALGGTNFNGVEDCEINPVNGMIYFTSKGKDRVYRFTDNGSTISDFETFVGGKPYEIETAQGTFTEAWGDGNDNLTFDDRGNLWVLQDGGNNYIWVVRPDHSQSNPNVLLHSSMPVSSEPTGLTFTPDFKYGFYSVQHPSSSNTPQQDATYTDVTFNASATVVFALREEIGIQAPVADFVADEVIVNEGETVTFTDLSTNNPDSRTWSFEGGTPATSTDASPVVTYNTPGIFNVTLAVTNVAGTSEEAKTEYITVEEILGVEETDMLKNISLYPNPTQGQVTLELNAAEAGKSIQIEVYDMLGRSLYSSTAETSGGNQKVELDLTTVTQQSEILIMEVTIDGKKGQFKIVTSN